MTSKRTRGVGCDYPGSNFAKITRRPADIQGVWEKLFYGSVYLGNGAVSALSGIDIALWDILGKISNQPIARLLGGGGVEKVVAYVGCMVLGHKPMNELLGEAKSYADRGFKAIKVRGGAGVERDIEVVRATANAVRAGGTCRRHVFPCVAHSVT